MRVTTTLIFLMLAGCSNIGADKFLHAGAGVGIGVASEVVGMTEEQACLTVLATGIAKEAIDPVFSIPDVLATAFYCLTLLNN